MLCDLLLNKNQNMSRLMRKPTICENKNADQLRGNREADQRLCFRYTDTTLPLLKSEISSYFFFFFLIQFYVPFKIISAHMRRANQ